jgi:hypothetical protein
MGRAHSKLTLFGSCSMIETFRKKRLKKSCADACETTRNLGPVLGRAGTKSSTHHCGNGHPIGCFE